MGWHQAWTRARPWPADADGYVYRHNYMLCLVRNSLAARLALGMLQSS